MLINRLQSMYYPTAHHKCNFIAELDRSIRMMDSDHWKLVYFFDLAIYLSSGLFFLYGYAISEIRAVVNFSLIIHVLEQK